MTDDYLAHCMELLSPLGSVRVRRMFGGHGLYVDDVFIAIVTGEQLYLKVDAASRARFEAAGCAPFAYDHRDGRRTVLSYYTAPEDALESPALMQPWARLALQAALSAAQDKARAATQRAVRPARKGAQARRAKPRA